MNYKPLVHFFLLTFSITPSLFADGQKAPDEPKVYKAEGTQRAFSWVKGGEFHLTYNSSERTVQQILFRFSDTGKLRAIQGDLACAAEIVALSVSNPTTEFLEGELSFFLIELFLPRRSMVINKQFVMSCTELRKNPRRQQSISDDVLKLVESLQTEKQLTFDANQWKLELNAVNKEGGIQRYEFTGDRVPFSLSAMRTEILHPNNTFQPLWHLQ